jgi:exopolysaccharide production protein ExoQ
MLMLVLLSGAVLPTIKELAPVAGRLASLLAYSALLGVLLLATYGTFARKSRLAIPAALYAFLGLAGASVLWSTSRTQSVKACGSVLIAVMAALTFSKFPVSDQRAILMRTSLLILVASALLALVAPQLVVSADTRGHFWQGVFTTKNVLGRFAAVSALNSGLFIVARRVKVPKRPSLLATLLSLSLSVIALMLSGSASALVVVMGTLLAAVLLLLARGMSRPVALAYSLLIAIGYIAAATVAARNFSMLAPLVGRDASLSGRTQLWQLATTYADSRPLLGYGFGAFFAEGSQTRTALSAHLGFDVVHAHNFILDLRLELGWIGVILWGLVLIFVAKSGLRHFLLTRDPWLLCLLTFILLSDLTETTSLNGIFPVLMLAAALAPLEGEALGGTNRGHVANRDKQGTRQSLRETPNMRASRDRRDSS